MKRLESHLPLVVSFALAGVITASLATGTAQSAVASLVQIVNTPANPVPTQDTDDRARQPITIDTSIASVLPNALDAFTGGIYTVPAGKRLVIEYISATGTVYDPEHVFSVSLEVEGGGTSISIPISEFGGLAGDPSRHSMIASQLVVMYANPGDILDVGVFTDAGTPGVSTPVYFTIFGHLVNLP